MTTQTQIAEQAKQIMDNFMFALDKAEKTDPQFQVRREKNVRESAQSEDSSDFRDRMFRNAPKVLNDCIITEKKRW